MARTPYDNHAKDVAVASLAPYGKAEADARISAETQYADLRFVRGRSPRAEAIDDFLTRELQARMLYEFAHDPPDVATVSSWLFKRDAWFFALRREARRRKRPLPALPPTLVALSAGDPVEARRAWGLEAPTAPGIDMGSPSGTFRLVVISQLPQTLDTLRVRTMGSGATLTQAIREVAALPGRSKLRRMLEPRLATLRVALENDPSPEAQEIVMDAQKIYNQRLAQQRREGRKEGREEGREEGLLAGLRAAIEQVCDARGLALTDAHRATLAAESDAVTLRRWLARASTATTARGVFAAM